jgi:hypothetical protein
MTFVTIPRTVGKEKELVLIPRRDYEKFLHLEEDAKKRVMEELDADKAVRVYQKEKRAGKLKSIKSLADLN